jgi:hypothetical protein
MLRSLLVLAFAAVAVRAADIDVLMPPSSDQVTYVNVKRLIASSLTRDMLKKEITERIAKTPAPKWMKDAGFDMWKDLDTVCLSMTPPKFEKKDGKTVQTRKPSVFIVARGRFDGQKLMEVIDTLIEKFGDKVSVIKENKIKMFRVQPGSKEEEALYATLLDENTLVASSSKDEVLAAVKADEEKVAKADINKDLAALIESLDDKAAFYQAMLLDGKEIAAGMQDVPLVEDQAALKKQVEAVTCYSMTARVAGDIRFEFSLGMKTKADAEAMNASAQEMVTKGKVMIGLAAAGAPEAAAIINDLKKSLKAEAGGTIVTASGRITGDSIKRAFGVEE